MEKHFCTCPVTSCKNHPQNHNDGCDPCIKNILELGEVPGCVWNNAYAVIGKTEYSMERFAQFYLKQRGSGATDISSRFE